MTHVPRPSHVGHWPEPLQKGQILVSVTRDPVFMVRCLCADFTQERILSYRAGDDKDGHGVRETYPQAAGRHRVPASFDRLHPSRSIRHSAVTNVYQRTRDLFLAQRFARHVSPLTTSVYTHPSDQEMAKRLRQLHC